MIGRHRDGETWGETWGHGDKRWESCAHRVAASPCRRVVNLGSGSGALRQGHLQVQALALA